ncbi:extracellular solute-binding protein [Parenemella sanctibonifatiensis]|uniref:extracellular solute-binding protein n=1 Tax=Parenemella sanctibonifatiensis TaxID=2016505 RepID=UPI0015C69320|nr:extracellular solute-binding protein [Parenemella sanctibonifatiensis]
MSGLDRRSFIGGAAALATGALALSACSTDTEPTSQEPPAKQAEQVRPSYKAYSQTEPDVVGDPEKGIADAYWTFPNPVPERGLSLPEIAPISFLTQGNAPPTARENNRRWKDLEEATGAEWNITFGGYTEYDAKFQTTVAGGDLPEFVQIVSVPRQPELLESQFVDLTEYLAGDKVLEYEGLAAIPSTAWDVSILNGRLWGIPQARIPAGRVMRTSKANLDAAGIDFMPEPSDYEELEAMFAEVTDKAGNKFAMGAQPVSWFMNLVLEAMGAPNGWRVNDDGTFVHSNETEECTAALEYVKKIWDAGYFHPNSFSEPQNNGQWWKAEVTTFYVEGFLGGVQLKEFGADRETGLMVNPKFDGGGVPVKHLGAAAYYAPIGISKQDSEERIRELLAVADYLASPYGTKEYCRAVSGVEGVHWEMTEAGPSAITEANKNEPGMTSYLGAQSSAVFKGPEKIGQMQLDVANKIMDQGEKNAADGLYNEHAVNAKPADTRILDVKNNIIQGRQPMSDWPAAVEEWKKEFEKARELYQELYAANEG